MCCLNEQNKLTMPGKVDFKVAFRGEPIPTNVALVRPFPCMTPNVYAQCRLGSKLFSTVATLVFDAPIILIGVVCTWRGGKVREVVCKDSDTRRLQDRGALLL